MWIVMLFGGSLMDTFFSYPIYIARDRKVMIETVEVTQEEMMAAVTPMAGSGSKKLSDVDKKMLQTLLTSSGRVSSLALSRKLEIPLTTVQRRRKRLESEFLEVDYSLRLDKLGWRNADLLISTSSGAASSIGKELLSHNAITRVCRSIGEHTIDLHAEIVFKNNTELLNVIEWIKRLDGVKDVVWTEPVEVVGKNMAGLRIEEIFKSI
jgi:DNA-binding Lrp family transcriptional regulator